MAQFGRPSADTFNGDAWIEDGVGDNSALFDEIDESVADDADYVQSPITPTSDAYVTKLTAVTDPMVSTGHTVRYRYGKNVAAGDQIDLTVQLRQGYVNEGSQGTLIHSEVHANVAAAFVAGAFTLTGGEADTITDYSDLYLRFVANKP